VINEVELELRHSNRSIWPCFIGQTI